MFSVYTLPVVQKLRNSEQYSSLSMRLKKISVSLRFQPYLERVPDVFGQIERLLFTPTWFRSAIPASLSWPVKLLALNQYVCVRSIV